MFLHVGADMVVAMKDIIAIVDARSFTADSNRAFLRRISQEKAVVDIAAGDVKSYIITADTIYISNISSLTLKKRADYLRLTGEEWAE